MPSTSSIPQEQKIFALENRLKECENGYEGTLALERAKVKELTEKHVQLLSQVDCDKAEINLLRKYIESLDTTIEMQEQEVHSIKADTVKKMQDRLKEKAYTPKPYGVAKVVDEYEIDQIAKEILE